MNRPVGHVEDEFHLPEDGDVGGGGDEGGGGDVDMDILNLVAGLCSGYPTTTSPQHKQQVCARIGFFFEERRDFTFFC